MAADKVSALQVGEIWHFLETDIETAFAIALSADLTVLIVDFELMGVI
ncbi:MAG: hypothetical protein V2I33_21540 [Kangiellaceae bacterium]|nr:hypothetical protein [Kangiellaceae bacterium]